MDREILDEIRKYHCQRLLADMTRTAAAYCRAVQARSVKMEINVLVQHEQERVTIQQIDVEREKTILVRQSHIVDTAPNTREEEHFVPLF